MAKYATTETLYQCWGCGLDIPIRSMWTKEEFPQTYRCPRCKENILFCDQNGGVVRSGAYYGPLRYADYNDRVFAGGAHVPVVNRHMFEGGAYVPMNNG